MNNQLQIVKQQIELARPEFESNAEAMKLNLVFQKEASFALQLFQANNYLANMDPNSIKNAIVNVSLTGLTLNPVMKLAYLIPRKGKCILDVSYMGLIKILTDTGSVKNIEAKLVHANEPFEIQQGTNPYIKHGIAPQQKGDIIGVYSIATLNDGSTSVEWMYKEDVDAIAIRSESVRSGKSSPWHSDYSEMARKTVIKRHYKYLPKSERALAAAHAIELDHENNGIDFETERREKPPINIDIVTNTPENIQMCQEIVRLIQDPRVPVSMFGGVSKEEFIRKLGEEFEAQQLTIDKANNILSALRQYCQ